MGMHDVKMAMRDNNWFCDKETTANQATVKCVAQNLWAQANHQIN